MEFCWSSHLDKNSPGNEVSKLKWYYPMKNDCQPPEGTSILMQWLNQRFSSPDMCTIKQWSCSELVFRSFASTSCCQQVLFSHICSGPAKKVRHYNHLQSLLLNSQGGLGSGYLDCKIMVLRTRGPGCSTLCKYVRWWDSYTLHITFLLIQRFRYLCMLSRSDVRIWLFKWIPLDFMVLQTLFLPPTQGEFPFHEPLSITKLLNYAKLAASSESPRLHQGRWR